jgi:hypothetical protein
MLVTERNYQGTYLILSLKWSDGLDKLNWWGPDNSGYTYDIDKAGRYDASRVAGNASYYDNEDTTRAVPLDDVLSGKTGPIQRIVSVSFRYPRDRYDCHACGEEVVHRRDPRFSPPACEECNKPSCAGCFDEGRCSEKIDDRTTVGEMKRLVAEAVRRDSRPCTQCKKMLEKDPEIPTCQFCGEDVCFSCWEQGLCCVEADEHNSVE